MVVRSIMRVEGGDIYAVLGWRVGWVEGSSSPMGGAG